MQLHYSYGIETIQADPRVKHHIDVIRIQRVRLPERVNTHQTVTAINRRAARRTVARLKGSAI